MIWKSPMRWVPPSTAQLMLSSTIMELSSPTRRRTIDPLHCWPTTKAKCPSLSTCRLTQQTYGTAQLIKGMTLLITRSA